MKHMDICIFVQLHTPNTEIIYKWHTFLTSLNTEYWGTTNAVSWRSQGPNLYYHVRAVDKKRHFCIHLCKSGSICHTILTDSNIVWHNVDIKEDRFYASIHISINKFVGVAAIKSIYNLHHIQQNIFSHNFCVLFCCDFNTSSWWVHMINFNYIHQSWFIGTGPICPYLTKREICAYLS